MKINQKLKKEVDHILETNEGLYMDFIYLKNNSLSVDGIIHRLNALVDEIYKKIDKKIYKKIDIYNILLYKMKHPKKQSTQSEEKPCSSNKVTVMQSENTSPLEGRAAPESDSNVYTIPPVENDRTV